MERILRWKGESEMSLRKSAVVAIIAACVPVVCLASAFTPRFERVYIDQDAKPAPQAQAAGNASSPNPSASPSPNASSAPNASSGDGSSQAGATPTPAPRVMVIRPDGARPHAIVVMSDGSESQDTVVVQDGAAPAPRAYSYVMPPPRPDAPVTIYAAPNVHVSAPVAIHVQPLPPMAPVSVDVRAAAKVDTKVYVQPYVQHSSSMVIRTDEQVDSYVIVSGNTTYSVIGSPENIEIINDGDKTAAQELRGKYGDHFIWFHLNGKTYVITDASTVQKAMASFDKMNQLGKMQEELGAKQEELGRQQEQLGDLQSRALVDMPDLSKEMDQLNAELKQLDTPENRAAMAQAQANLEKAISQLNVNSPDMEQQLAKLQAEADALGKKINGEAISRSQEQMGELQEKLGEAQGRVGESQGKLGELQGELGEKQGELGEKQGELGRQQEQASHDAERQLRKLFQDSVSNGTAKPQ
jgi:predicted  nucleic acid-binding Zn-ribbon protein